MDLWVSFWSALTGLLADGGLAAVALIVLLRSAAIPIPIPADLLMVMVGVRAREQDLALWPAWVVLTLSTTIGAVLLYVFVRWIGQGEVPRYGRYVGLSSERLSSAESRLDERGARAVFVARIVPGLRLAIVAVCAMLRFRWWTFVVAVICGALIYVAACLAVGYVFGPAITGLIGFLMFPLGLLEPVIGFSLLLFWVLRARRRSSGQSTEGPLARSNRWRAGAIAGALAVSGSTMLVNALMYVVVPLIVVLGSGPDDVDALVAGSGGWNSILESFLATILVGIIWGLAYGALEMGWGAGWADWQRGLSFAALPFVLALLLAVILIAPRDVSPTVWGIIVIGEAIRWGTYGVLLALIYPVLCTRLAPAANSATVKVQSATK